MTAKRGGVVLVAVGILLNGMSATAEPLPSDPAHMEGKLENGLRWIYRKHDNPPGKMAILIHVDTGSLNEKESQRGLAHFMEHMCFNGSEHYAPGELVKYWESIGMEFGADANASTGFEATRYMLFLPDAELKEIDTGLMTISDYVFGAKLIPEEIEKERNIVLEEWRRGRGAAQRVRDKEFEQVFAGTRFSQRLPIGLPEVIKNAGREEFVDYYRTWYRPERMTLILVGDADPKPIIPLIEKWFGKYKPEVPAREEQTAGFKPFEKMRSFVFTDPELPGCSVQLINVGEKRPPVTTTDQYRRQLVESVGTWIVNRRLQERVQKGEASYRFANASVSSFVGESLMAFCTARGEPADWNKMLDEVVTEIVRANEHGFTERELELAKKEIKADAERAVETEPTRSARGFLFGISGAVGDEEPFMSAKQELDIISKQLGGITVDEVTKAFRKHFQTDTFAVIVETPEKEDVAIPSKDDVMAAARAVFSRKTSPIKESETASSLLAKLPQPGKIVESTTDDDLGVTSAWLENGVRVHHRFMDYKKDTVLVGITLAGGRIEEKPGLYSVTEAVTSSVSRQPATRRLSSTDVRDLMTGKNIRAGVFGTPDAMIVSVFGSPKDLESGLQLTHAVLTEGKIEPSAIENWKKGRLENLKRFERSPEIQAMDAMSEILGGGDPRVRVAPTAEQIESITLEKAQAWMDRICKTAPIEVAVVGEIDKDTAMQLVSRYIGSLPKRERSASRLDSLRTLPRETGPYEKKVDVDTVTDKAMAIAGFVSCEARNVHDSRAMEIASKILTSRVIKEIRENQSLVYSIRARNSPSVAYRDAGQFVAQAPCDPHKVEKVVEVAHKIFGEFAKSGPTAEELENAKKQIENNLDEAMKEPRYWFGVLNDLTYHGKSLEDEKQEPTAYRKYAAEDVTKVFRKYYTPQRKFSAVAVPARAKADSPKEPAPAS